MKSCLAIQHNTTDRVLNINVMLEIAQLIIVNIREIIVERLR